MDIIEKTGLTADEVKFKILSVIDETEKLAAAQNGMSGLQSSYQEWKDNKFVKASTLEGLDDVFKELDGFDMFKTIAGDPNKSKQEIQNAFDDIAKEYILSQQTLYGMTTENASIYVANLKEMGITNAQEVCNDYLSKNTDMINSAMSEYEKYLESKSHADLLALRSQGSNNTILLNSLGETYKKDYENWLELLEKKTDAYNDFVNAIKKSGFNS